MRPVGGGAGHALAAALAVGASVVACGGGTGPGSGAVPSAGAPLPPALSAYERVVAPFPVLDEQGEPFQFPFLGGTLAPRPQFVDIDGDGDLDLFVQQFTNDLWFFENVGSPLAPRFEWRTDRYQDLDIGEWYRFADIDADGLPDLLSEEPFSYIRYYRNVGTRADARFAPPDSLRDAAGAPIFMDRQNIPAIVDLDCNDRLDLFVGRVEGIVTRYEAVSPGSDRFVFLTEFWEGIEIIGAFSPDDASDSDAPTVRHGANALQFADFDRDGDLDLFWGDYFEPGMLLIENIGRTCSSPSFQVEPVVLPGADGVRTSGYNAPAPVDLNGDGQLDFAMGVLGGAFNPNRTASDNFYHWERVGNAAFELRTTRFLDGIDVGAESVPTLVDLDRDGLLDLVIGSKLDPRLGDVGVLHVYRNEGTRTAPRFRFADTLALAGVYHQAPAFADLDGDGRLDLLLGTWNGEVLYFRGEGAAGELRFAQDSTRTVRLQRGSNAVPALADLDGDGLLDLLVGQANGTIAYYRNEGTLTDPRFELVTDQLGGIDVGRRSAPTVVDLDGDGLLDLVVGREEGGVMAFRNVGSASTPEFAPFDGLVPLPLPPLSAPAFGDLTGDGVLDVVSGSVSGGIVFYRGTPRR